MAVSKKLKPVAVNQNGYLAHKLSIMEENLVDKQWNAPHKSSE